MQQITKFMTASKWFIAFLFAAAISVSCNNSASDEEIKPVDTSINPVSPAPDTSNLPPLDTTATSRPEDGRTR